MATEPWKALLLVRVTFDTAEVPRSMARLLESPEPVSEVVLMPAISVPQQDGRQLELFGKLYSPATHISVVFAGSMAAPK